MPAEILVPPLSQTMDSLVLVIWLKNPGDPVTKGEPLFTVETDKATLEVEAPASGILGDVLAQPGDEIQVRSVIGHIALPDDRRDVACYVSTSDDETVGQVSTPAGDSPDNINLPPERQDRLFATPRARTFAQTIDMDLEALRGQGSGPQGWITARDVQAYAEQQARLTQPAPSAVKATPLARRIASQAGIELETISPSKPGAALRKADVESALLSSAAASAAGAPTTQRIPLSPTRRTIARRLSESHLNIVPVTYMSEVVATRLVKLRKRILEELPEGATRPTITDFLVWITCRALRQHPELNATFDGEVLEIHNTVHIALAVDTERGLLVPVIRNAGGIGLFELAKQREVLVRRTLEGQVTPEELSGGTFTLSNLGTRHLPMHGIDHFTPVINPPQVAILGVGRVVDR
jgi:pyruvate dehydrogenase E2 component (dihydrolipoamide acetyltransferase)